MRKLLSLFLALLTLGGMAQGVIDLEKAYSINAVTHGEKELGQVYTLDQVKTTFKDFYRRKTVTDKFTDAQVMTCRVFSAAYMDAIVKTDAFGGGNPQLISVVNIDLPNGKWLSDLDGILPYGTVQGKGTFVWYPTNVSTQIVMDNAGWQGTLKDDKGTKLRTLFVSPTYGQEAFVASYHESMRFYNVRLTGNCADTPDPSYLSYGLYVWDMGETGDVEKVYAHNFNTAGFAFERMTPGHCTNITAFNCHLTGIHLRGTAMGTIVMDASVDDCESMFRMDPSWGREAGGTVVFLLNKKETGVTAEVPGRFWNGTIVGYCQGQFTITCLGVSNAAGAVKVPCMFFVNSRLKDGTLQRSSINVTGSKGFNCQSFIHDAGLGIEVPALPDYSGAALYYTTAYGGEATADLHHIMPKNTTPCKERLGFFRGTGTFNYQTCTPALRGTITPPVTTCTGWTTGAWSTCTNGTQTRTVTATPSGCTGTPANKPVESQSCSITPPTSKWSKTYTSPTTTSTKVAVPANVNPIQSTKLVNVKFSNLNIAYVNSGLFVGQDGYLWLSNGFVRAKDTAGNEIKLTAGQVLNVTVPMPNTTLTNVIGGAGSTAVFTGTVEVW